MFKKLANLITPAPKRTPVTEVVPPVMVAPAPDLSATLKPLLKALTSAPQLEDPAAQDALAKLKQVGLKCGLYVTAFEIRMQMDMMARSDQDGVAYHKERGYILAGDFFYSHIARELQALRAKSHPIGPNIFRGYCNEMEECLIRSGHARRAIEIPVLIVDDLLASVVDYPDRCEIFLDLAQQVVLSTSTIITHYANLQRKEAPVRHAPGAPTPVPRGFAAAYGEPMLSFVEELQTKLLEIRSKASQMPGLVGGASEGASAYRNPLERDQALLAVANAAQYYPFCGIVKERIAGLLVQSQQAKAVTFLRSAADSYETEGDIESELRFTKLPARRYQKAQELYTKASDAERAARAKAKLEKALQFRNQSPV